MKKSSRFLLSLILATGLSASIPAADDMLKPDHPQSYVVKKGDTLWGIAGMFLERPWLWPNVWQANPQIKNPDLIYPGDEITIDYVNGKPVLRVNGKGGSGSGKLSPEVRHSAWDGAIPTVPVDAVGPFLGRPQVISKDEIDSLPYLVALQENHVVASAGDRAYARVINEGDAQRYDLVRAGKAYLDAETGETLGYQADFIGTARVEIPGDPATVTLTGAVKNVNRGDLLLEAGTEPPRNDFMPRSPDKEVRGHIIDALDALSQIGQYTVVVIDRGTQDGLAPGHVLQIDTAGQLIKDSVVEKRTGLVAQINPILDADWAKEGEEANRNKLSKEVMLPEEKAGLALVFRTFDRLSFALVMHAFKPIHRLDIVRNPE